MVSIQFLLPIQALVVIVMVRGLNFGGWTSGNTALQVTTLPPTMNVKALADDSALCALLSHALTRSRCSLLALGGLIILQTLTHTRGNPRYITECLLSILMIPHLV